MATTETKRGHKPSVKTKEINDTMETNSNNAVTETKSASARTYAADDLIPCRSITGGFTNFKGRKSGNIYNFLDNGDIAEIEYADLRAAMLSRSQFIYDPVFVIEDEELLSQHEWASVKKLYEGLYNSSNIADVLELPVNEMKAAINKMPVGSRNSIATIARTMIDNGEFDSMNKIKALDEILGTDLALQFS